MSAVHMLAASQAKPIAGTPAADWKSTWASLTFARLEPDSTQRSAR